MVYKQQHLFPADLKKGGISQRKVFVLMTVYDGSDMLARSFNSYLGG